MWHMQAESPLLLYGVSKEVVEFPGYWPSNIHVCGFWFLPSEWQFSCNKCREMMSPSPDSSVSERKTMCAAHVDMQQFLMKSSNPCLPLFIGLSSIGSMGFLKNPHAFLRVLEAVLEITEYSFVLFSAGYEPLDAAIQSLAGASPSRSNPEAQSVGGTLLFNNRIYCFSGSVPYSWLFPRCAVAIHHGGSGSTAAALHAGIPQIVCPFILDQFYWAERLHWIGVAPEPLQSRHLLPDNDATSINQAADSLVRTIKVALSPEIKSQALKVANRISSEDGLQEALKVLKEKLLIS
ncbi:hypothetical protein Cni_G17925 [Canna indica]|uniref:Erythromycin biosynthesis protein CIII-like C-terminal domain-containing protein n=1 Tax=Canna indica TaxID=4628 RepID=A0AAQ3KJN6_9LILI|nr:hypothetical protein Cni_G17925 [Canna indica]